MESGKELSFGYRGTNFTVGQYMIRGQQVSGIVFPGPDSSIMNSRMPRGNDNTSAYHKAGNSLSHR